MKKVQKPGPISGKLQKKNSAKLAPDQYAALWRVMQKLGHDDFLSPEQGLITLKFLKGENVFGVLPTGGGKSFTFQTVARMTEGVTLIISPLIALMKDQVSKNNDRKAVYFNSDLTPSQKNRIKQRICNGKVRLVYISPERLKSEEFRKLLGSSKLPVKRVVIDEAHCVIEWGYGFRIKYLHIAKEIEAFEKRHHAKIPVLLLTATASPWLQKEIVKNLRIRIPRRNFIIQQKGSDRPELEIQTLRLKNDLAKNAWLIAQLKRGGQFYHKRGIIFSAFADGGEKLEAQNAESISTQLRKHRIRVERYHGGMNLEERRRIQEDFQNGRLRAIVATKAFGMGIDMPKLDFIIHYYPPLALEEYWQEAGRGGRGMKVQNGERCHCIVLYSPLDYGKLDGFGKLARFEKTLSTYTVAVRGEICLNREDIRPNGKLRKLLDHLHNRKDIRRLRDLRVNGIILKRWKLRKPVHQVLKHLERFVKQTKPKGHTKPTRRLRNNLRMFSARKGDLIRVEHGAEDRGRGLGYYDKELNWLTEPDIAALELIDDAWHGQVLHSQFRVLKPRLTRRDMRRLGQKIEAQQARSAAKLRYVFTRFLNAPPRKSKQVIMKYLNKRDMPA